MRNNSRNGPIVRTDFRYGAAFVTAITLLLGYAPSGNSQKRELFNPDGSFWIQGTPRNDFENFSGINLNSKQSRRLQASGVALTDGTRLRFKTLTVARDKLVFTTVVVRGYSYSFRGRFLKGGEFASTVLDPEAPVLEGMLLKWRRGQKVANAKLVFTYFGGT